MPEPKHNPGPWDHEDVPLREERSAYVVVKDADGRILFDSLNSDVAEIHEEGDEDGFSRWDEAGRRNLRLAAAAPDLLEAADLALEELREHVGTLREPPLATVENAILRLALAIAKAKGRPS